MFAYRIEPSGVDPSTNTIYLWMSGEPLDYETREPNIALLREDYKFVVYLEKVHRVCQVELDDEKPFIKFWVDDPFEGYPDYEQIEEPPTKAIFGEVASEIWDILKEAGAPEGGRSPFIIAQMKSTVEYRFGGTLGFGGKFWNYNDKWYVNCYPEDLTPDREKLIGVLNEKLAKLKKKCGCGGTR